MEQYTNGKFEDWSDVFDIWEICDRMTQSKGAKCDNCHKERFLVFLRIRWTLNLNVGNWFWIKYSKKNLETWVKTLTKIVLHCLRILHTHNYTSLRFAMSCLATPPTASCHIITPHKLCHPCHLSSLLCCVFNTIIIFQLTTLCNSSPLFFPTRIERTLKSSLYKLCLG